MMRPTASRHGRAHHRRCDQGQEHEDILGDFLDEAEHGRSRPRRPWRPCPAAASRSKRSRADRPNHRSRRDADANYRRAVTDADIRAGCINVAEQTNLAEEQDAAVFKAALSAKRAHPQLGAPSIACRHATSFPISLLKSPSMGRASLADPDLPKNSRVNCRPPKFA